MNKIKKLTGLTIAALVFFGCASNETPTPNTTSIEYYFVPDTNFSKDETTLDSAVFSTSQAKWTVEKAMMVTGEIGIHWEEAAAPRSADLLSKTLRHDVEGGKPSPKIQGFFAIDFMKSQNIQKLKVEEGVYSHIHMMITNDKYIKETLGREDKIRDIDNFPELKDKGRSFYFSGKVAKPDGSDEKPFEIWTTESFGENSLGDIVFTLPIYADESYVFKLSPKFKDYFSGINISLLQSDEDGTIRIHNKSNYNAWETFTNNFTLYRGQGSGGRVMDFQVIKSKGN